MNKIAKRWVKALRSGKYKQGKHALTQINPKTKTAKHCCLGVLCKLAVRAKVIKPGVKYRTTTFISYNGTTGTLPEQVRKWVKLRFNNGALVGHDSLVDMNDGGKSFKAIARHIEQRAEDLFE